jgi:hypothetical protein
VTRGYHILRQVEPAADGTPRFELLTEEGIEANDAPQALRKFLTESGLAPSEPEMFATVPVRSWQTTTIVAKVELKVVSAGDAT